MSQFTLPELNFDINSFFSPPKETKKEVVVIGEKRYHLNKSRSKFVSVGLCRNFGYEPCIKLMGNKNDVLVFTEEEWRDLLKYQGVITNYLYANAATEPLNTEYCSIFFEQISSTRVIKIWKNNSSIYLGYETICNLWEILPIINYRIDMLKIQQFKTYFKVFQKGMQSQSGNIFHNATTVLKCSETCPTENVCLLQELVYLYPAIFEEDCLFTKTKNEENTVCV